MLTRFDKLAFASIIGLVALIAIVAITSHFWNAPGKQMAGVTVSDEPERRGKKSKDGDSKVKQIVSRSEDVPEGKVTILQRWNLPAELSEISAISYIDAQRLACIQDEKGVIYVYNTNASRIERTIAFGPPGDYEGMTLGGGIAYVTNSSGVIYEVNNIHSSKPAVKVFSAQLSAKNDVEGLGWDQNRQMLLLTVKKDGESGMKGIYAFDLKTRKRSPDPVISLDMNDKLFAQGGNKKSKDFQPSSISVHRTLGHIYVLESAHQRLLILNSNGTPQQMVQLVKADFAQPEGITFSPEGDMFISNEGKEGRGNILKVTLN